MIRAILDLIFGKRAYVREYDGDIYPAKLKVFGGKTVIKWQDHSGWKEATPDGKVRRGRTDDGLTTWWPA